MPTNTNMCSNSDIKPYERTTYYHEFIGENIRSYNLFTIYSTNANKTETNNIIIIQCNLNLESIKLLLLLILHCAFALCLINVDTSSK